MNFFTSRPIPHLVGTSLALYGVYKVHKWYLEDVIYGEKNYKLTKYRSQQQRSLDGFPDVILQNIISYVYLPNTKLVSKKFHELSEKNDQIELMKAKKLNKQQHFIPNMKTLFDGTTLVVDANRYHLNQEEQSSGYEGPFQHIIDVVSTPCKPGDTLLILIY